MASRKNHEKIGETVIEPILDNGILSDNAIDYGEEIPPEQPFSHVAAFRARHPNGVSTGNTRGKREMFLNEQKARDVSAYLLPDDLDARAALFEDDDPSFVRHIKIAHKYHSHRDLSGIDPWKIEVKARNESADTYNRHVMTRRAQIPTPEDIREAGIFGDIRLVLSYYDPFKQTKGGRRGGVTVITSKPIEIVMPHTQVMPGQPGSSYAPNQRQPMPSVEDVSTVQQVFDSINTMTLQAMDLQMKALLNRQTIVQEGIAMGRLQQQIEERDRKLAELQQQNVTMQNQIAGFIQSMQNHEEDELEPEAPKSDAARIIGDLAEKYLPPIIQKFTGANGNGEEKSEECPQPQQ